MPRDEVFEVTREEFAIRREMHSAVHVHRDVIPCRDDFPVLGLRPALGRLLRDTVRTGTVCRYDPDPTRPVRWLLDEPDRGSTR